MPTPIKYIITVIFSPDMKSVVGLTKRKGPKALLNRVTFPGGKIEPGESPAAAATRELLEETGVVVAESTWVKAYERKAEDHHIYVLAAIAKNAVNAMQKEEEPVWILDVEASRAFAKKQPEAYAEDFLQLLNLSFEALALKEPVQV